MVIWFHRELFASLKFKLITKMEHSKRMRCINYELLKHRPHKIKERANTIGRILRNGIKLSPVTKILIR